MSSDHRDSDAGAPPRVTPPGDPSTVPTQVTPARGLPPTDLGGVDARGEVQETIAYDHPAGAITPSALPDGPGGGPATPPAAGGDLVAGRYELVALLGRGGMGSVYRARDATLGEEIALKFLARELTADPALQERFRREVVLARKVTHRNVARMFDIGEHDGARFLTMELIDGEALSAIIARSGPLAPPETLRIARAVLEGLAAAHGNDVVHRDLKPDNVMIERSGRVAITDFGVARALKSSLQSAQLTGGQMVGTPAYMAPEQLEGRDDVGPPADLYALGVMLFQMMTGELPWPADSGAFALIRARLDNPTPRLDATPFVKCPHVTDLVARLMAEDPRQRFPDASAVLAAIDALPLHSKGQPTPTRAADAPTRLIEQARRGRAGETSVAVLPLTNRGPDDDDYLADGLTEELIDILSTTPGLRVRPYRDVARLAGQSLELDAVGRTLGVEVVVEGTLRRAEGALRLSARLLSVQDGFQLWAKRFSGTTDDPFALSDEIAEAIAEALTVELSHPPSDAAVVTPPDPQAIDLYLRARHALIRGWFGSIDDAIRLFDQALERAPRDPRILSGAADAYARQIFYSEDDASAAEAAAKARELAERAIVADPRRGEAHHALGMVCLYQADPVGAIRGLRGALERNADLAESHASLGRILIETGPLDEAQKHLEQALRLDPSLPQPRLDLVRPIALTSDWDQVEAALEPLDANDMQRGLSQMLRARYALWFLQTGDVDPEDDAPPARPDAPVARMREIQIATRRTGRLAEADRREMEDRLAREGRTRRGALYFQLLTELVAFTGDHEAALGYLAQAVDAGLFDRMWMRHAGVLRDLRADPRFAEQLARVDRRLDHATTAS